VPVFVLSASLRFSAAVQSDPSRQAQPAAAKLPVLGVEPTTNRIAISMPWTTGR